MKLTPNATAKVLCAITKALEIEVAKHTSEREYLFDYEKASEGDIVLNIYPKEPLPGGVADGATIRIEDCFGRDKPYSHYLTIENNDGGLDKVGVSHSGVEFDQQIATVVTLVLPTLLV